MLPKVLAAFEDAWLLTAFGLELPSVSINGGAQDLQFFVRLRGLLFLWLGIALTTEGAFSSIDDAAAYAVVMGESISRHFEQARVYAYSSRNRADEYEGANATRTHPEDVFGYGLSKFRCPKDYAHFYEHMADDNGDGHLFGMNPAERFDVTCMMCQTFLD